MATTRRGQRPVWARVRGAEALALALIMAGTGTWSGCEKSATEATTSDAAAAAPALDVPPPPAGTCDRVEVEGCWEYLKGPICELAPQREIALWVGGPKAADDVEIAGGDERVEVEGREAGGGFRYAITVPDKAKQVTVKLRGASEPCFTLDVRADTTPRKVMELRYKLKKGEKKLVRLESEAALAKMPADDPLRGVYEGIRARAALEQKDKETARKAFEAAIPLNRKAGRLSDVVRDAKELTSLLHDVDAEKDALALLADLEAEIAGYHEGEGILGYRIAAAARDEGLYARAWQGAERAERAAMRAGPQAYLNPARQVKLSVLSKAAQGPEDCPHFLSIAEAFEGRTLCEAKVRSFSGYAACMLAAREVGHAVEGPVADKQNEALGLHDQCPQEPSYGADGRFNLAVERLQAGDLKAAEAELDKAAAMLGFLPVTMDAWRVAVKARRAIADGLAADALKAVTAFERATAKLPAPVVQHVALVARADALLALAAAGGPAAAGHLAKAAAALSEAEKLRDDHTLMLPLGGARDSLVGDRAALTAQLVDVLGKAAPPVGGPEAVGSARARAAARKAAQDKHRALVRVTGAKAPSAECAAYVKARADYGKTLQSSVPTAAPALRLLTDEITKARAAADEAAGKCFGGGAE